MAINIITYSGKTRTAKHDAIVYDAALNRSGIFNGCKVTANEDIITVALGYGIIKGRVFEVTEESFNVNLPGSGSVYGALVVTFDLNAESPLVLETIESNDSVLSLEKNENANFANGRYQMLIATYTLTPNGVTDLVQAAHILPIDHIGSTNLNDYVEPGVYYLFNENDTTYTNLPNSGISNGWLVVYDGRYSNKDSGAVKQIFYRHGSTNTHHQTYIRTRTAGVWNAWNKIVMDTDLESIDKNVAFGSSTRASNMISVISSTRNVALHVAASKRAGIWDNGNSKWIMYSDDDQNVYIPHKLTVGAFNPEDIDVGNSTDTTAHYVAVENKYRRVTLHVSPNENAGIYDSDNTDWIMRADKNLNTYIPHPLTVGGKLTASKSFVRGSTSITVTKADTPSYKDVTWSEMGGTPTVTVTAVTTVPQKVSVGVGNVSSTGCRIYLTRSDGSGATSVSYIAMYT